MPTVIATPGLTVVHPYDQPGFWNPTIEGIKWDPAKGLEAYLSVKHEVAFDQPKPNASSRSKGKYKGELPPVFSLDLKISRVVGDLASVSLQTFVNLIARIREGNAEAPVPLQVEHPLLTMFDVRLVAVTHVTGGKWEHGYWSWQVTLVDQTSSLPLVGTGTGYGVPGWETAALSKLGVNTKAYVDAINKRIGDVLQNAKQGTGSSIAARVTRLRNLRDTAIDAYNKKVADVHAGPPQASAKTFSALQMQNQKINYQPGYQPPALFNGAPSLGGL